MKIGLTENQKQAIESIDKSMLVVAGAGSGKTLVLVRRFVEILQRQPELTVHNLLAVTYTHKAAKEMRTRIKARLKELYEEAQLSGSEERMRWHKCLADMDSAYIGTIHSLCQSILQSFTIEIGLDPQIEVMDEIEKAQIMQESIDETFRQIIAADNADKSILEHFPLETVEGFLQVALHNHLRFDQIAANLENLSTAELIEEIEKLLTRTQKQLLVDLVIDEDWFKSGHYIKTTPLAEAGNKLESVRQQAAQYFASIQDFVKSFTEELDAHLEQEKIKESWKVLLDLASMGAVRVGGNTDAAKEMRATIKMLIDKGKEYSQSDKKGFGLPLSFTSANGDNEQYWQLWRALLALSRRAQNNYAAKKLEIGKLDFDDLIAKTKTVLQTANSAVRRYYNSTLAHILVDEFQDTNPIQAEIIELLAGTNTKLFLIGDDKQSIYKFQGAEVSTFNAWQRKEIDSLVFEHSFRSQTSIVNFVNGIFSNLLPAQKAHVDYRAKYSALIAQRDQFSPYAHVPQVEVIQLPDVGRNDEAEATTETDISQLSNDQIEGTAVANWILDKVTNKTQIVDKDGRSREINYGDFAVLTASNDDLQIFESCLSELNIPYVTSGGRTFFERQEIYDLENMLLFLSNHSNSHALLAVLRSPMFSVSDEIIHNLASKNSMSLWQTIQDYAAKQSLNNKMGYQMIAEAVILLKRLLADLPVLSLSELIYRIIRDTNYDLVALTLPDGKQRYKNIWKFYMLAKDEFSAAVCAERLALSRQLSINETNAAVDNKQSVKLMTIHKAKGLEFPAVALPFLSDSISHKKPKLLFHDQYGIVLNTSRNEQERDEGVPLPYQLGKTLDDDMDLAEKKRLLYVATTRARDHLALFTGAVGPSRKSAASWLQPLLTKLDGKTFSISAPELNDLLAVSKRPRDGTKEEEAELDEAQRNRIEQLLEPLAINSEGQATAIPEVSLPYRITPNSTEVTPSPVLIGKFFHRIMEYLPQDKVELKENELAALLEQFADEAVHPTFKRALIEGGKKLLSVYAKSDLQRIFSTAKTICHEWSYYMNIDSERLLLNRPDLLLESKDGEWYLIDYKTDRFSTNDIEQQALRHRPQLERYGKDFSQLTKIEAKLAIYFAQSGTLYIV